MSAKDLTNPTYAFWQVIVSNILKKGGYLSDVSSFDIYALRMIVTQRKINFVGVDFESYVQVPKLGKVWSSICLNAHFYVFEEVKF